MKTAQPSAGIHAGDWGTALELIIIEDGGSVNVSSATTKQVILHRPDNSTVAKSASFTTTGADGKIRYVTVNGDFDPSLAGTWSIQGYVVMPSGAWKSSISTFEVLPNL